MVNYEKCPVGRKKVPRKKYVSSDDGKYNYVAYLLADENGNSIKVAKYSSLDRCDLVENNEYGYCSLI